MLTTNEKHRKEEKGIMASISVPQKTSLTPSSRILLDVAFQIVLLAMSAVENKQKLIQQLRAEANIDRIKLSTACKDLIKFCQDHENGDVLVIGWEKFDIDNPYKDKNKCVPL